MDALEEGEQVLVSRRRGTGSSISQQFVWAMSFLRRTVWSTY